MPIERLYRDVALALTGSNPRRDLVNLEAIHGHSAEWFTRHFDEESAAFGAEAATRMAVELVELADIEARNPSFDVDPVSAYLGYAQAREDGDAFRRWTGDPAAVSGTADFSRFAQRMPRQAGTRWGIRLRAAEQGLIRSVPTGSDSIYDAWVDSADCVMAQSRGAQMDRGGAHVACRDSTNLTGCPHFAGLGVDALVRCQAARVRAQTVMPPKIGDEMDVKEPDGTTSKIKVKRVDPDGSAVVEPTWKGQPSPV